MALRQMTPAERRVHAEVDDAIETLVESVFEKGEREGLDSVELGKALLAATSRFEDAIADIMVEDGWLAMSNGEWIKADPQ